jgi:hypothetical protein
MMVALEVPRTAERHPPRLVVSCIACGWVRETYRSPTDHVEPAMCPICQHVGWLAADPSLLHI